ncbi:hypothetical protein HG536_0C00700 [Torulaspora globosa]|uniref:Thioredoxin domain-containing protein n=1 Tax=Torulaspora globosa TaxID=48254 RepID=A0A7G3ZEG7_9SACH|nr:uncharacterized protein HG536_0C00700 [Torulaspora globosa]QLL31903.1 hypothetical protein HG536_0C00700 [Torulaspora globosa]
MDKISSYERRIVQETAGNGETDSSNAGLDELMDELEDDDFMASYREKRMQQISDHLRLVEKNVKEEGYGSLLNTEDESMLIKRLTKADNAVVHFALDKFAKCQYMDRQLSELAQNHPTTIFLRIDVEKCPFLVSKLGIKVLPFVVCYKQGKEVLRIVGFSKLGNNPDHFSLSSLASLLRSKRVIGGLGLDGQSDSNADDSDSMSDDN